MGEPLLNYDETIKAVRLLNSELGVSMRHLTISTIGIVPNIHRLAQEKLQLTLAVLFTLQAMIYAENLFLKMTNWSVAEIIQSCQGICFTRQVGG